MAKPIPTPIPDDVKARFWAKVDKRGPDECWPWLSTTSREGYGSMWVRPHGSTKAHRLSFVLAGNTLSSGLVIDHLCRNRACVNPAHMEAVTNAENIRRGTAGHNFAGRRAHITHCPRGHEYTPDNVLSCSRTLACRTCANERSRAAYLVRKARKAAALSPVGDDRGEATDV